MIALKRNRKFSVYINVLQQIIWQHYSIKSTTNFVEFFLEKGSLNYAYKKHLHRKIQGNGSKSFLAWLHRAVTKRQILFTFNCLSYHEEIIANFRNTVQILFYFNFVEQKTFLYHSGINHHFFLPDEAIYSLVIQITICQSVRHIDLITLALTLESSAMNISILQSFIK